MLTEEQIKNLKPGDKLALSYPLIFREYDSENDELLAINNGEYICFHAVDVELPSEHGASVPTSTRLFKKGDRIRFKTWHGFQPSDWENEAELLGKEATVYEDQEPDDFSVHFLFDGEDPEQEWHATYLPFIELVTPVEYLEPYYVGVYSDQSDTYFDVATRNGFTVVRFDDDLHPHAKEAAEAECARLNAEYRKEHTND